MAGPSSLLALRHQPSPPGADNEEVLAHLRAPGPHVAGCWCVDLLTGRS
jgi:hypothetical protein